MSRKPFRRIMLAALVAAVLVSTGVFALLVPSLPKPAGEHPVVSRRVELILEGEGEPHVLHVWHPVAAGTTRGRARYDVPPGAARGVRGFLARLARTQAAADGARLRDPPSPRGVLFYEHGLGGHALENFALCADLASRGFLVLALDHSALGGAEGGGPPTADFSTPDAAVATHHALAENIQARSNLLARVADALAAGGGGVLAATRASTADWSRCGVFGFSLGGAVALDAAARHPRFFRSANMDGLIFCCCLPRIDCPLENLKAPPLFLDQRTPDFLAASSLRDAPCPGRTLEEAVIASEREIRAIIKLTGARRIIIDEAAHDDFTDAPHLAPLGFLRKPARHETTRRIREALAGHFLFGGT